MGIENWELNIGQIRFYPVMIYFSDYYVSLLLVAVPFKPAQNRLGF